MESSKILWLDDQYPDFSPYISALFKEGYLVDLVRSVSEVIEKLKIEKYRAFICDIKVLPGNDPQWIELDKKKRTENPDYDPALGLELLRTLFNSPNASVKTSEPTPIDPRRVIVFSVVYDKTDEISSFGVPVDQIVYKSDATLATLPGIIRKIENV